MRGIAGCAGLVDERCGWIVGGCRSLVPAAGGQYPSPMPVFRIRHQCLVASV
jgi:hypothetical protein